LIRLDIVGGLRVDIARRRKLLKSVRMPYSLEFKRAVAAAAITRLSAGSRNLEAAALWVSTRLGDAVYADRKEKATANSLLEYRKKILNAPNQKAGAARLAIARYHYDHCLEWVGGAGLKPEESAQLLVDTLRSNI